MILDLNGMHISGTERRQAVAHLKRGLKTIESKGWCQNTFQDSNKRVCAWGAVGVREGDLSNKLSAVIPTVNLLIAGIKKVDPKARLRADGEEGRIFGWNDRRGRKVGQVKRAFKHAIKIGQGLKPVRG